MALYEITFLTKEETDPGVRDLIEQAGGAITEESTLGQRRLTYPIKKQIQAVFTTYGFDIDPDSLAELNQKLRLDSAILRYLMVTKPILKADKEVSKTVREAIEAAEKLEDTLPEAMVETPTVATTLEPVEEAVAEAPATASTEPAEVPSASGRKGRATKKAEGRASAKPADAAEATEEDRLKALEDKLGEILGQ